MSGHKEKGDKMKEPKFLDSLGWLVSLALPYMATNGKMGVSPGSTKSPDKCSAARAWNDIRRSFLGLIGDPDIREPPLLWSGRPTSH